jgi:DNA-binding MarR family transcriptional regulator
LEWLWEEDNISIGQLAKRTSKDNAALSRIIDGMERNNLVNRISSSTDKRSYQIVMTKHAREILEKLRSIEETVLNKSIRGLNPIEVKELIRMLEHLYEKLD